MHRTIRSLTRNLASVSFNNQNQFVRAFSIAPTQPSTLIAQTKEILLRAKARCPLDASVYPLKPEELSLILDNLSNMKNSEMIHSVMSKYIDFSDISSPVIVKLLKLHTEFNLNHDALVFYQRIKHQKHLISIFTLSQILKNCMRSAELFDPTMDIFFEALGRKDLYPGLLGYEEIILSFLNCCQYQTNYADVLTRVFQFKNFCDSQNVRLSTRAYSIFIKILAFGEEHARAYSVYKEAQLVHAGKSIHLIDCEMLFIASALGDVELYDKIRHNLFADPKFSHFFTDYVKTILKTVRFNTHNWEAGIEAIKKINLSHEKTMDNMVYHILDFNEAFYRLADPNQENYESIKKSLEQFELQIENQYLKNLRNDRDLDFSFKILSKMPRVAILTRKNSQFISYFSAPDKDSLLESYISQLYSELENTKNWALALSTFQQLLTLSSSISPSLLYRSLGKTIRVLYVSNHMDRIDFLLDQCFPSQEILDSNNRKNFLLSFRDADEALQKRLHQWVENKVKTLLFA